MKFYTILLAVIYVLSLNVKANPSSVYHVRKHSQIVPYQTYLPGLRRLPLFQTCFKNNKLTKCPISSHPFRFGPNIVHNMSNINFKAMYDKTSDADPANVGRLTPNRRLNRLLVSSFNKMKLKLNKHIGQVPYFNLKSFPRRVKTVENSSERSNTVGNSAEDVETVKIISETTKYLENSSEKVILSTVGEGNVENTTENTLKTSSERVESLKPSLSLEEHTLKIIVEQEKTPEIVESISYSGATKPSMSINENTVKSSFVLEENSPDILENCISPLEENVTLTDEIYLAGNDFGKRFIFALDQFERKLYATNFNKFLAITPATSSKENGMSFVQSGLFLEMALMAFSTEVDIDTMNELEQNFRFNVSNSIKTKLIKQIISSLPNSSDVLKFRWSSRLVLRSGRQLSQKFRSGTAKALQLKIAHFNNTYPESMAKVLNRMIEEDSGGAIRDTFDEEDLSENEQAVFVNTLYFRARWRSPPTLLNGTSIFRDSGRALPRTIRMIRINDVMKYADLPEWDAEAIEIPYLTEGLNLLMLVPRGNSLRHLAGNVTSANLWNITERMQKIRIAVVVPLYTLRMTLLLPNKLQAMGILRLVDTGGTEEGLLRITQAVQRIMFWAEAGRNAYKDDGFEWDETPQMKIVVDRPYIFSVRYQNLTLMLGNFVL